MNPFAFAQANTVGEALAGVHDTERASFVAGGTNILDLMKYGVSHPGMLVDVTRIPDLNAISALPDGGLRLGALATNAHTAYHPEVEHRYPLLSKAILAGASPQIRNMATNGGNLLQRTRCYYFYDPDTPCNKREPGSGCSALHGYNRNMAILGTSPDCIAVFPSDMCVALAALDARVQVAGPAGERSIAFGDFHRLPGDKPEVDNTLAAGELITSIDLPAKGFEKYYTYLKIRDRSSYSFALISVALAFELEDGLIREARLALGGVAHKPWRSPEAEQYLAGKEPIPEHFSKAAALALDGAVGYEHNHFKIELARRAIVRTGMMALQPETQLPGAQPSL
ncbi:FAD binding domain-containing protein [Dyadobacter sandarakinus]|uniref:Xanthine dehydrogenase family protein subunit M n=1 Tax=Dyadobacter sandarakinus TaxID=2747268 RepID=A0ABX7I1F0_9BACT|nr:xanthine dehydrogenase family protein subunit M [Dyadobacter sandarakinus]QRQ99896.1 xanthine dehydrogenase family protein subunit M [Dyadobacter sandarakinus]